MAWQVPKTDWAASDGIRDTDMNRIEENIKALYEGSAAYGNIVVYVSPSGNDTSGDGSSTLPYRTISKALQSIPSNFNGASVSLNIAAGTYNESVVISNHSGGALQITGVSSASVTVNSLVVDACSVSVSNINLTIKASPGLTVRNGGMFVSTGDVSVTGGSVGVSVLNNAQVSLNVAKISKVTTGISARNNGRVFVFQLNLTTVGTGMTATDGGRIAYGYANGSPNSAMTATSTGGRIYTGGTSLGDI